MSLGRVRDVQQSQRLCGNPYQYTTLASLSMCDKSKDLGAYSPSSLPLIGHAHRTATSFLGASIIASQQKSFGDDYTSNDPNQLALTEWD